MVRVARVTKFMHLAYKAVVLLSILTVLRARAGEFNNIAVTVNGTGTAVTTVGAPPPAKGTGDYYHFNSTAGTYPWASVYWWCK